MAAQHDYDVVIVGSGFGGSVSALRLVEKGYSVLVIEAGRRFTEQTLPTTSWRVRDYFWAPKLGCTGIQRIMPLRHTVVLAGAGVGGGSLVYANTLYVPPEPFFRDRQWGDVSDWQSELAPHYDQARRMLGVVENPEMTPADEVMRRVADEMGVGHTFRLTPVGVFFGDGPGVEAPDPFFGGAGPARKGCTSCGECMTGCRHGAKNTLLTNYLYLAERGGVTVRPLSTVRTVRPLPEGGYAVDTIRTGAWRARPGTTATITAGQVIFAAGAMGTQRLLHRMRDERVLPRLSPALGRLSRTNSESLVGAVGPMLPDVDYSRGVAITSSFYPEPHTHVEPVRYGHGSNAMGLLATLLTDGGGEWPRWRVLGRDALRHPIHFAAALNVRKWSQRSIIALVMQHVDNSLTVSGRRTRLGRHKLTSAQGEGEPNPSWIPAANETARRIATAIGGRPMGAWSDLIDAPLTAHFIGGAVVGDSPERGVVDPYHRVHGYPDLHIVDGSALPANPGVNPSMSITALAEHAMSLWPNKGEVDPRPAQGQAYQRLAAVAPHHPVVPASAPGALRLPIVEVLP